MTFYAHYQDKYDLLNDLVHTMGEGVRDGAIGSMPIETEEDVAIAFGKLAATLLDKCTSHKDEILSVRRSGSTLGLAVFESAIEEIVNNLVKRIAELQPIKYAPSHVASFLMGGFQKLILTVLEEPELDKKALEEHFHDIVLALLRGKVIVK